MQAAKGRSYREGEIFWDGRVRTPAPTKFGESSGFSVGADDLGGPRAHSVRPYREKEAHLECSLGEGIPPAASRHPSLTRGALREEDIWGAFSCSKSRLLRGPPHPSGFRAADSRPYCSKKLFCDWVGEALGPPAGIRTGSVGSVSQAHQRDRTSRNFCKPRAQWPGGNSDQPLRFCAPEISCLAQGVTPVNGVRG